MIITTFSRSDDFSVRSRDISLLLTEHIVSMCSIFDSFFDILQCEIQTEVSEFT